MERQGHLRRQERALPFRKEDLLAKEHQLAEDLRLQLRAQAERLAPHFPSIQEVELAKEVTSVAYSKKWTDEERYGNTNLPEKEIEHEIPYDFEVFKGTFSDPDNEDKLLVYTRHPYNSMKDYKVGFDQWGRLVGDGLSALGKSDRHILKWVPRFLMSDEEIEKNISGWHESKGKISELIAHLTFEFFSTGPKGYARKYHGRYVLPMVLAGIPRIQFSVDGTLPNRLWERIKSPAVPLLVNKPEDFGHSQNNRDFIAPVKWRNREVRELERKYKDHILYFVTIEEPDNLFSKLDWGPVLLGDLFKSAEKLGNDWYKCDDNDRGRMMFRAYKLLREPLEDKPFIH